MNYYIYYKIRVEDAERLRPMVEQLLSLIEARCGVRGRWMHRRDDPSTYMEVYEGVADERAFESLMASEGARLGVERRVERFVCA